MSKGGGSNKEAIKLQKESLAESKIQNRQMLALLQAQVDNAKALKLPKLAPPMPLPEQSSADNVAFLQETRRNLMKRNGLNATRVVPMTPQTPLRTAFGTPMGKVAHVALEMLLAIACIAGWMLLWGAGGDPFWSLILVAWLAFGIVWCAQRAWRAHVEWIEEQRQCCRAKSMGMPL